MPPTALIQTAAAVPATEPSNLGEGVILLVVGMGVVFLALTLIMTLVMILGRLARELAPKPAAAPAPAPAPTQTTDEITPELVAVLTAAAVAATGGPVRVRRVTVLGAGSSGGAWLAGGRASLMGSHRPGHRRP